MTISPKIKKSVVDYKKNLLNHITADKPYKKLCVGFKRSVGRNNSGRFTVYKNKGHKKLYRIISFKNRILDSKAKVVTIEYDPNRNAFIALIFHVKYNQYEYIIACDGLKVDDYVVASTSIIDANPCNTSYVMNFPIGTFIHNIESVPNSGAVYARSAGTYAQIIEKRKDSYVLIRMPSKETRLVHGYCMCSVGIVSNILFRNRRLYKAGQNINLGVRPKVRGVAKNPVDHPHGGRARAGTKRPPCNFKGLQCKGFKTVRKVNKFIVSKKNNKK